MSPFGSRQSRRALLLSVALVLTAGPVLVALPAGAQPPRAVDHFDVASADNFPADALNGERNASASDELLLTDAASGLSFRRLANGSGTQLIADVRGDPRPPVFGGVAVSTPSPRREPATLRPRSPSGASS